MNVIIEGPDGAGKSTLIDKLSTLNLYIDFRIQNGEGPPKYPGEINERARRYMMMDRTIFDRHPCVSQPIYGTLRERAGGTGIEAMTPLVLAEFYSQDNLFIYCRAERLTNHVVKPHEDPRHIETLTRNYELLVQMYDTWAVHRAHLIYRIGDDHDHLATFITSHALKKLHLNDFDVTKED